METFVENKDELEYWKKANKVSRQEKEEKRRVKKWMTFK